MIKKQLLPLVVLLMICISACKKDGQSGNQASRKLVGTWITTRPGNANAQLKQEYTFNTNGTSQFKAYYVDIKTGDILGYSNKSTANYKISDLNTLEFTDVVSYIPGQNKGNYVAENELVKNIPYFTTQNFKYSLVNRLPNQLDLTFICPPNANCTPPQVYTYLKK